MRKEIINGKEVTVYENDGIVECISIKNLGISIPSSVMGEISFGKEAGLDASFEEFSVEVKMSEIEYKYFTDVLVIGARNIYAEFIK